MSEASRLKISTLGGLSIRLNGEPVTGLASRKVEAMLVYLACTGRTHPREALAEMFWPERTQAQAMSNLRVALSSLRKHLGPFVTITRDTVAANPEVEVSLDVSELGEKLRTGQVEQAVDLYQGDFLEGFFLRDARDFDDWATIERERLRQRVLDALGDMVAGHLDTGSYKEGIPYARRLLQIDPLLEEAHRQLMRLLAYSGQRGAALAQYETCRQVLADELTVEPVEETNALYEQIQAGALETPEPSPGLPQGASALRTVRGYELYERIGAGGFGEVYRARQPSVLRQVAIKIILPQFANQPDFIRRFEREAQLVARLEHPHIVPLYDYWREPDLAYLVMRWLRGGNLGQSLQRGPWNPEAAARLLDQLAGALAVAHRHGVVHRDVKPENILLDEQDNAYLSDFGIAKDLLRTSGTTASGNVAGSLAYISPEQAQGQPVTPQSDLYSLGVVMFHVLTGEHPYSGATPADQLVKRLTEPLPPLRERRPDLPTALEQVIQQATDHDPTQRYDSIVAFAAAFREAVFGEAEESGATISPPPDWAASVMMNPYKGLRPFQEVDAADFFGRTALTEGLLARLSEKGQWSRFLAVVGPSGCGKSSVVKAGLLPALRRGALPGSQDWFIVEMLPSAHPLDELEIGLLRVAASQPAGLMEQLRRDERGLLRAARLVLPPGEADHNQSELLLIIDQFEELFTHAADPDESEHLLESLYAAVSDPRSRVRVVITLRADFFDRPLLRPDFGQLMRQRTEVVVPLTVEELADAIRQPGQRVGAEFESGLVTTIVTDVSEQPGALPMLQYALTELFERAEGRSLTHQAYRDIGGVSGALARRAEEVYGGVRETEQTATRQLFLRLVTLGEGSEDTRRRVLRSELETLTSEDRANANGVPELRPSLAMDGVIAVFGQHRLLTFDRNPTTREPTVEVAHEALLREWRRLGEWLEESRADVREQRLLDTAAAEWVKAERDPGFLLRGSRLNQFEGWATSTDLALTHVEREYLDASVADREERQAEEAARRQREAALEQRSRRNLRALAAVFALATVVALVLMVFAFSQRGQARQKAALAEAASRLATARELAAFTLTELEQPSDPSFSLALLLAREAVLTTWAVDDYVTPAAEAALRKAIDTAPSLLTTLKGHNKPLYQVAWSPDGARLATASADGTAKLWNVAAGPIAGPETDRVLRTLVGHGGEVTSLAFSPEGRRLATASSDNTARIWDAETGRQLDRFEHPTRVDWVAWSPDGRRIATVSGTTSQAPTVRIWDIQSGEQLGQVHDTTLGFGATAWSPDGCCLLLYRGPYARIWNVRESRALGEFIPGRDVLAAAWSPDGERIVTGGDGGDAHIWDVETGKQITRLEGHTAAISSTAWRLDGAQVLTAGADRIVRIWDAQTGRQLGQLQGHTDIVTSAAWSPDGDRIATASWDGSARVWSAQTGQLSQLPHQSAVYAASWSPDGGRIATAGGLDRSAHIWDAESGAIVSQLRGHLNVVFSVAWSPDGRRIVSAGFDGSARIWDPTTGEELLRLEGHTDEVLSAAWSPADNRIVTAGSDGVARIWDARSGEELGQLGDRARPTFAATWSPECVSPPGGGPERCGARILTVGGDTVARIWDTTTEQELSQLDHGALVNAATWSPDGAYIVTAGDDHVLRIWDVQSGELMHQLKGHLDAVRAVGWSPDGERIVSASDDRTARIWDAQTGKQLGLLEGHTDTVWAAAWSPDGAQILTASADHSARVWPAGIDGLLTQADALIQRDSPAFTPEERCSFLHQCE